MILLLRALARLSGLLLLAVLALAGLAGAVFSIQAGTDALSLENLSELVHLPALRDTVGAFLRSLQAHGPVAILAALSGAGAMLLGFALLAGVLIPRRERLLVIDSSNDGTLAARRRAAALAIRAVAEQSRDVQRAKAKVRPRRTGAGGRLLLTLYRAQSADQRSVLHSTTEQLTPLSEALSLRVRIRSRVRRRHGRVS